MYSPVRGLCSTSRSLWTGPNGRRSGKSAPELVTLCGSCFSKRGRAFGVGSWLFELMESRRELIVAYASSASGKTGVSADSRVEPGS